jgi:cytoskeletal protein CcmA (bactofilin family)
MRVVQRSLLLFALTVVLLMPGATALAADIRTGGETTVPAGETVADDLYVTGGTVTVDGTVQGDLVAAGGSVTVNGTVSETVIAAGGTLTVAGGVTGDVIVAGGTVVVSGTVGGDLRGTGGTVQVSGQVQQDAVVFGGNFSLREGATVGGDVILGTGAATLNGDIGGDLTAGAGDITIDGRVGGTAEVEAGERLRLGPGAAIVGGLEYTSPQELSAEESGRVQGPVTYSAPARQVWFFTGPDSLALRLLDEVIERLQWFVATVIAGLVLLWLTPYLVGETSAALRRSPLPSLGLGLLALFVFPVLAVIIGVLALFVTGAGGLPILAVPLLLWLTVLFVSWVFVSFVVGELVLERAQGREPKSVYALIVGAAVLAVVDLIPFVGGLVRLLVIVFGMGGLTLGLYRLSRLLRTAPAPASPTGAA